MMQNPCEIILVRHGETAWNKEGRLQGQQEPGPPLDELGFQQAVVVSFARLNSSSFQAHPFMLTCSLAVDPAHSPCCNKPIGRPAVQHKVLPCCPLVPCINHS